MAGQGFSSDDVVNRRVNSHLEELLPSRVSTQRDYHFEGQRLLPPEQVPGDAETCLCYLETYVGQNGCFEVHVERVFDRDTDGEWTCTNRVCRDGDGPRQQSPFEYAVRTKLGLLGDTHADRSCVEWATLDRDPIYGGREAQAAVLLAEKMSHYCAREEGNPMDHRGSLASLGSLSNVVDTGRQVDVDWEDVDALLGPDAETIAATTGFEELVSDEKRQKAEQKGIDFLRDGCLELLDEYEGAFDSDTPSEGCDGASEPWQTIPAEMSTTEAEAKLRTIRRRIREMQDGFGSESEDY